MIQLLSALLAIAIGYVSAWFLLGMQYLLYLRDAQAGNGLEGDHVMIMLIIPFGLGIIFGALRGLTGRYPPYQMWLLASAMLVVCFEYLVKCNVDFRLAIALEIGFLHLGLLLGWSSDLIQRWAKRRAEEVGY